MLEGDLCPHCLRPNCAGDAVTCPARFDTPAVMAAQTLAEARAAEGVTDRCAYAGCGYARGNHWFVDGWHPFVESP